jgi:hypothetical protein
MGTIRYDTTHVVVAGGHILAAAPDTGGVGGHGHPQRHG